MTATFIIFLVVLFIVIGLGLAGAAFVVYRRVLRRAKNIERALKMVPLLIHLPPPSADTAAEGRDLREVMREKISQAETLYNLIAGTALEGFKSKFYGQRHLALEIVATGGTIHYYIAAPVAMSSVIEQAIVTAYPGATVEEVEDYNLFNLEGKIRGTAGGELGLKDVSAHPIATYKELERDPMEALLNTMSSLKPGEGAGIQILIRPAGERWAIKALDLVRNQRKIKDGASKYTAADIIKAAVKPPGSTAEGEQPSPPPQLTNLELARLEAIEDKTKFAGYESLIRVVASGPDHGRAETILHDLATAFALFDSPGSNGFKFMPALDPEGFASAYIFRFFPPEIRSTILNSVELATLFHLPDAQFTAAAGVERQTSKQVDGPASLPQTGLLLGFNNFRGVQKQIHLGPEDRRRHSYIVGQTGTGKTTLMLNLAVQDMLAGNGFAFIDPHGDAAEKLLGQIPPNRSEDVIYFNPADTEAPLGLNLFEFKTPEQKDFLIQETIGILYKLYDPGHTGIIGPRYEHWFRNAALTLMSDPEGGTFIEIPKVFTDSDYLKQKFKHITDPTVIDFWTKEMAATSDYHKSEMLGWFVSKFGAFMSNEMMRNIIGQTKSAFDLREVMDQKKILIVNLSKGLTGELNSQLLGMIFVMKFQAAAMSRADVAEEQRGDFSLYVDEFQNFSTDSFAAILSEARKYRLNLIVANQFIGQLNEQTRDAVFGNVGTIVSFRTGPEDADFLVKQFAPVFDARDLVNLPNLNAVVKLMVAGLPSQPFSMTVPFPSTKPKPELAVAIKQLSAAKFGATKAAVEQAILGRMQTKSLPDQPGVPDQAAIPATPSPASSTGAMSKPPPAVSTPPLPVAAPVPPPPTPVIVEPIALRPKAAPSPDSLTIRDIVRTTLPPKAPVAAPPVPAALAAIGATSSQSASGPDLPEPRPQPALPSQLPPPEQPRTSPPPPQPKPAPQPILPPAAAQAQPVISPPFSPSLLPVPKSVPKKRPARAKPASPKVSTPPKSPPAETLQEISSLAQQEINQLYGIKTPERPPQSPSPSPTQSQSSSAPTPAQKQPATSQLPSVAPAPVLPSPVPPASPGLSAPPKLVPLNRSTPPQLKSPAAIEPASPQPLPSKPAPLTSTPSQVNASPMVQPTPVLPLPVQPAKSLPTVTPKATPNLPADLSVRGSPSKVEPPLSTESKIKFDHISQTPAKSKRQSAKAKADRPTRHHEKVIMPPPGPPITPGVDKAGGLAPEPPMTTELPPEVEIVLPGQSGQLPQAASKPSQKPAQPAPPVATETKPPPAPAPAPAPESKPIPDLSVPSLPVQAQPKSQPGVQPAVTASSKPAAPAPPASPKAPLVTSAPEPTPVSAQPAPAGPEAPQPPPPAPPVESKPNLPAKTVMTVETAPKPPPAASAPSGPAAPPATPEPPKAAAVTPKPQPEANSPESPAPPPKLSEDIPLSAAPPPKLAPQEGLLAGATEAANDAIDPNDPPTELDPSILNTVAPGTGTTLEKPQLSPGEVAVDNDGNVVMG